MSENSKIEWTDATWNPIRARRLSDGKIGWHCEHMSDGCSTAKSGTNTRSPPHQFDGGQDAA